MAQHDAYRRLADWEVEHHGKDLLYADRQALKGGGHAAVIAKLRRRKYRLLWLGIPMLALMVILAKPWNWLGPAVVVLAVAFDYAQLTRTEKTLRRLAEELEPGAAR
jgi:hypothetical protein